MTKIPRHVSAVIMIVTVTIKFMERRPVDDNLEANSKFFRFMNIFRNIITAKHRLITLISEQLV